eukprot:1098819-Prorocentrum_minimum.AAC.2
MLYGWTATWGKAILRLSRGGRGGSEHIPGAGANRGRVGSMCPERRPIAGGGGVRARSGGQSREGSEHIPGAGANCGRVGSMCPERGHRGRGGNVCQERGPYLTLRPFVDHGHTDGHRAAAARGR